MPKGSRIARTGRGLRCGVPAVSSPRPAPTLLAALTLLSSCLCGPGPRERWDLDDYLADRQVAVSPRARPVIPPFREMDRRPRERIDPALVPTLLDVSDLPGEVGELPEPDERMSEADLVRVRDRAAELVSADPGNQLALWYCATARQVLGDAEGALRGFNQLVIVAPGLAEAHVQRAILLADLFRFEEALLELDFAEKLRPGWDIHLNRGIALCFAERFEEAEWDLWKAVEADPADGNAWWDLAWVYARRGDAERTVEMLRWAARDPELFGRRFSRDKVRYDVFLSAVGDSPVFVAYTGLLPEEPFMPEPGDRTLRGSSRRALPLPEGAPDGVEPGSGGGP